VFQIEEDALNRRKDYKTRQRENVLSCFLSQPGRHMTAAEVCQELAKTGMRAGRTTVYRSIALLYEKGVLISFNEQHQAAPLRYQLREKGQRHIIVRCSGCGMIASLACEAVEAFEKHLSLDHGFALREEECLLPGLCSQCQDSGGAPETKGNP
jgi:Fur family ferric uptake transcriptional regulator